MISSPAAGQAFNLNQVVATSFACSDGSGGPGVASCVDANGLSSPGLLLTSTVGPHAYTVSALSGDGEVATVTAYYTVVGPPTALISSPADGRTFNLGQHVATSFDCVEGPYGPGISSCADSRGGSGTSGTLATSSPGKTPTR